MLRHSGFLVGCCGALFAVGSFLIGLELSSTATHAAPSVEQDQREPLPQGRPHARSALSAAAMP